MNTENHRKVVELAVPTLPEGSRAFWSLLTPAIVATCKLPDEVAIPLLNGADGPWRHYFPQLAPKHSFEKLGAAARAHFFDVDFYVSRILDTLKQGDVMEACRFLGVFSHYLGDFAEPAHYYEHEMTLLLPPPPDRLNCNTHRMIEDTRSTVTRIQYQPRVLGHTADTVVMRLEGRLRQLYEISLATIVPMLGAIYRRDTDDAARLVDPVVAGAAKTIADMLHSVWCIHSGQWTREESLALATCRLDTLEPASYDVEFNYGCRPIRSAITLDQVGRAMPLRLLVGEAGGPKTRTVEGLCVVPHALPIKDTQYLASMDFKLPPNAFNRFTALAGLLSGFEPQAPCRFVVESEGGVLFESKPLCASDPAIPIDVDLSGLRLLRLVVHTDGSTDKLAFPIWAWPTIENRGAEL